MSDTHKTVKSPNPSYRSLIVTVPEEAFVRVGGKLPPRGTKYGDDLFRHLLGGDYRSWCEDYVYFSQGNDSENGGTLIFAPGIPEDEADEPFNSWTEFKEFYWDPILKAVVFVKDPLPRSNIVINAVGQGVANQDTYHTKDAYVPGGKIGTLFLYEEFFSPIPFDIPFYESPVTASVSYSVPGARGGFANSLHERIELPNLDAGVVTKVAGNISSIGGSIRGQIFPETNYTEWSPVVVSHTQQPDNGYHAVRITALPPDEPETII